MSSATIHSAETYVSEPKDLWEKGLPERFRAQGFRVKDNHWVMGDQRMGPARPRTSDTADVLSKLASREVTGAVLYPTIAARAYTSCQDPELLSAVLRVYNEWILDLAKAHRDRLAPMAMLNVDDPDEAKREIERTAAEPYAGYVIPVTPGKGRRYDQPPYERVWAAAGRAKRPLVFLPRTTRGPAGQGVVDAEKGTLAGRLSWQATAGYNARRSAVAITYAGVFERHPDLHLGIVGFGASWAIYAMLRADEAYEVRPERTGPAEGEPSGVDAEFAAKYLESGIDVHVSGKERSGKIGLAPEHVGYHYPEGVKFSDHFKKHVFKTFRDDPLGVAHRDLIGVEGMLWGLGAPPPPRGPEREHLSSEELFKGVPDAERRRMQCDNTARLFGLRAS